MFNRTWITSFTVPSLCALAPSLLALTATAMLVSGCGGSGSQRAQDTSKNLDETRVDVGKGGKQIDETLAALSALIDRPQGDSRKAYDAFSDKADRLKSLSKDIDEQSKALNVQSVDYFKNWETDNAQITDQQMRAASTERRNDLQRRFGEVTNAYENAKRSLQPFLGNLADIQRYLGNDLSTAGIGNVAPAAAKAKEQGAAVKRDLASVQVRIDELSASMGTRRK